MCLCQNLDLVDLVHSHSCCLFSIRSLAVGARNGYRLFSLNSVDQIEQIYENGGCQTYGDFMPRLLSCLIPALNQLLSDSEDICIVERLFSSSLVAVVSLSSPRKLKVCHFKKGTEICNYSYSNTILAVKLNRAVSLSFLRRVNVSYYLKLFLTYSVSIVNIPFLNL